MTSLDVRALENARAELKRARNEFKAQQLRETRYRGVRTFDNWIRRDTHGTFTYRGVEYTK